MSIGFGSTEIIQIADAVAREKNIDKEWVLEAMEISMAIAARKKYGNDKNIKALINRKSGEISIFRETEVVADDFEIDPEAETEKHEDNIIRLSEAKQRDENLEVGSIITEELPPIDLGRVAAQTAKQVIVQKVREAEREKQFETYKDRIGEIINGTVKRVEFGDVIVDLGQTEAIIKRDQTIRGEMFRINDRIRAYIQDVRRENKGAQIFLSRTDPQFMAKLFMQEVPEIYDGIIEIKSVAREPGSRAKIAVKSNDFSIDPVGSCVGMRGSRVQAVINELQGEKVDIIQWSEDPANVLVSALAPSEVSKVVIDEDNKRIEAIVPEDQLSLAIGRRGQNVRLASDLIGWKIDIMTEKDESERRTEDFNRLTELFTEALNVEEIIAQLLVSEGFTSVEDVALVDPSEISSIEGFDDDIADALQGRAKEHLESKKEEDSKKFENLGIDKELQALEGLPQESLESLAKNDIKTLDDFADLSRDEFKEIITDSNLKDEEIDALIMKAREHWFTDEGDESNGKKAS